MTARECKQLLSRLLVKTDTPDWRDLICLSLELLPMALSSHANARTNTTPDCVSYHHSDYLPRAAQCIMPRDTGLENSVVTVFRLLPLGPSFNDSA